MGEFGGGPTAEDMNWSPSETFRETPETQDEGAEIQKQKSSDSDLKKRQKELEEQINERPDLSPAEKAQRIKEVRSGVDGYTQQEKNLLSSLFSNIKKGVLYLSVPGLIAGYAGGKLAGGESQEKKPVPQSEVSREVVAESGVHIKGFENSPVLLSNELMQKAFDSLPPFLKEDVNSIEFKDESAEVPASYGISEGRVIAEHDGYGNITFYRDSQIKNFYSLVAGTLTHELAHRQDKRKNPNFSQEGNLSQDELENLDKSLTERVESDDRFKSDYVEAINNVNYKRELSSKKTEWWAEGASEYHKPGHGRLNTTEIKFFEYWFQIFDPSSDPEIESQNTANKMITLAEDVQRYIDSQQTTGSERVAGVTNN